MPHKFTKGQRVGTEYGPAIVQEPNEPGTHYFIVFDTPFSFDEESEPMIDACLSEDRLEEIA